MKALYRQTLSTLPPVPRPAAAAVDMDLRSVLVPRKGDKVL